MTKLKENLDFHLLKLLFHHNNKEVHSIANRQFGSYLWFCSGLTGTAPAQLHWRTDVGVATSPKARGRFRAGLRYGPLRWMRDWGFLANNHPLLWGRSARRRGASGAGNVSTYRNGSVAAERWRCADGWIFTDIAIVASSIKAWRVGWSQTDDSKIIL